VVAMLQTTPANASYLSIRSRAKAHGSSRMAVQWIWKVHQLQLHRVEIFKLPDDPQFMDKVRDVVGLQPNPPAKAGNDAFTCPTHQVFWGGLSSFFKSGRPELRVEISSQ
jgi:hypothetical protein